MSTPRDRADPRAVSAFSTDVRWFGVAPPLLLLLLAAASFGAAIALLAAGLWQFALIVLALAALLAAAFLEGARRRPDSAVTRASAAAAASARERTRAAVESLLARSSAIAETQRVRSARAALASERRQALLQLGEAVHGGDEQGERDARTTLAGLDRGEEALEERLRLRLAETEARLQAARLSVQRTILVRPDDGATPPQVPPGA